jgi:hypothetical protein
LNSNEFLNCEKGFAKMEKVFTNQPWTVFPETSLLGPLSFSTRADRPALPLHHVKPTTGPAA